MYFNYHNYNQFWLGPAAHENFYRYFLPRLIAANENKTLADAQQEVDAFVDQSQNNFAKRYNPILYDKFYIVLQNRPLLIAKIWLFNNVKTLFGLYTTQLKVLFNSNIKGGSCSYFYTTGNFLKRALNYATCGSNNIFLSFICIAEIFYLMLQYIFILFACFDLIIQKKYLILFFLLSFVSYIDFLTGHDGFGRYRMMFEPALLILIAGGIFAFYKLYKKQNFYYEQLC